MPEAAIRKDGEPQPRQVVVGLAGRSDRSTTLRLGNASRITASRARSGDVPDDRIADMFLLRCFEVSQSAMP